MPILLEEEEPRAERLLPRAPAPDPLKMGLSTVKEEGDMGVEGGGADEPPTPPPSFLAAWEEEAEAEAEAAAALLSNCCSALRLWLWWRWWCLLRRTRATAKKPRHTVTSTLGSRVVSEEASAGSREDKPPAAELAAEEGAAGRVTLLATMEKDSRSSGQGMEEKVEAAFRAGHSTEVLHTAVEEEEEEERARERLVLVPLELPSATEVLREMNSATIASRAALPWEARVA